VNSWLLTTTLLEHLWCIAPATTCWTAPMPTTLLSRLHCTATRSPFLSTSGQQETTVSGTRMPGALSICRPSFFGHSPSILLDASVQKLNNWHAPFASFKLKRRSGVQLCANQKIESLKNIAECKKLQSVQFGIVARFGGRSGTFVPLSSGTDVPERSGPGRVLSPVNR
jgi:hypothetical protein